MKPKLFIGSSSEALSVANAIQENLNYDAEVTVWNQGVFKLSSTSLQDLLERVNQTDFAILVFNPDDIGIIRNQSHSTVRDNVIFELGLFIGKLTQGRVFYILPENEEIHLTTDLLGVNPGYYNNRREDKNLLAALGPFCNQVRNELQKFQYANLGPLLSESENAKNLAIEKPFGYEYLILAELIENRLSKIAEMERNLQNEVYFYRSIKVSDEKYREFFGETLEDFQRFATAFNNLITSEIQKALGLPGVPSEFNDLRHVSDQIQHLATELFNWEVRNQQMSPPEELSEVKSLLKGTSKIISANIHKLPNELRRVIKANQRVPKLDAECKINIELKFPPQINQALEVFKNYYSSI